tara:strand:- start:186 stop:542 length:357 start_codon:yes stop_codon:yes gene_type:complete
MGMEEEALRLLGLALLASEIDDDEVEFNEEGEIVKIPSGWVIQYLVAVSGYSGDEWVDISEVFYSEYPLDYEGVLDNAGLDIDSGLYIGKGEEQGYSVDNTPIRKEDIPENARIVKSD